MSHSLLDVLSSSGIRVLTHLTEAQAGKWVHSVGVSACLGTSVFPCRTYQTPGGLAVSLLTTKAAYNMAISLGSLATGQKLGEVVHPGTHQASTLLMKLKPLDFSS